MLKTSEAVVFAGFSFVCITSPTLGSITSGYIGNLIGGYSSKWALPICLITSLFAASIGITVPLLNDYIWAFVALWFFLFLGGITLPLLMGIMLSSCEPELRPKANALANLNFNIMGYLPGPFVYGTIC